MAKTKQTRRMIAMALAAAVVMSSMPVAAFAAEGNTETTTTSGEGTPESPKVTVTATKETNDGGSTTETTTTTTESTETNDDGSTIKTTTTESAETTTTPDAGDESDQPAVSVTAKPGEEKTAEASSTETTGPDTDTSDGEWDYTETTETEREVELEVTEGETVTTETEGDKISASETEKEGIQNTEHEPLGGPSNEAFYESMRDGDYLIVQAAQGNFNGTDSGNVVYYVLDKDGNVKLDYKGNPVLLGSSRGDDAYQLLVKDTDGNYHTLYHLNNGIATEGLSYNEKDIADYEDRLAYGEDSVTGINSIAKYGYWGTDSGLGSLEKMQSEMKASVKGTEDGKFTIGGVTFDSREAAESAIDALKDGDAQLVTNAALASFADGYAGKDKVKDTDVGFGDFVFGNFVADQTDVATLQMVYQYLMDVANTEIEQSKVPATLEEMTEETTKTETVVEDVSLKVYDKDSDAESNTDDNNDNDVYHTDLSIKMVVTKDGTLKVYNGEGKEIAKADISNKNGESQTVTFEGLTLAENEKVDIKLEHVEHMNAGVYVLEPTESAYDQFGAYGPMSSLVGLKADTVTTTTSYSFEFNVDENDKTVVKNSKRTRKVTSTTVDKDNEGGGGTTTPEGTTEIEENKTPLAELPGFEVEENPVVEDIEISDEDVPLAGTPEEEGMVAGAEDVVEEEGVVAGAEDELIAATGDSNHMAAGFGGMFAALAGMFMLRRKKEN